MAINKMEDLCIACGKITKPGDRRVIFTDSTEAVNALYSKILESNCNDEDLQHRISNHHSMCRSCFGKYQRVIDLCVALTLGMKQFISILLSRKGAEEESSNPSNKSAATKSNAGSCPIPSKKSKLTFDKGIDETVSPGVAVSS